jgi:type IV secretory pathway component VirB8
MPVGFGMERTDRQMPKPPIPVKDEELGTRELVLTLNKRLAVATVSSGLAVLGLSIVILALFPLKETKPYVIEVARDGAAYVPPQQEASAYKPKFDTVSFFIRRWISDAFTINQYGTVQTLDPRARRFLRGATAIGEYKDFVAADGKFTKMAEDPSLVRDVEVVNIIPVAGTNNGVVADVKLTTRSGGTVHEEHRMVTIYYEFFSLTDRKDIEENPIGIFITDFKVSNA